ncbi:ATP-NAD kinase family protein [Caldinitratiruptor microaerophilus]|uniref:ATP-NAD kinase n=1 Tax=Caldinitratiruptor microaerophilus TaxID=671077 RepID=A0AA35CIA0_9FIRM|nr:NAD(+)/NADH kinase [Caldinitratiruptor microaerophilus]BDG59594.1 ATP-NAD kinase [Caldinitratiruptor microaerophilus]
MRANPLWPGVGDLRAVGIIANPAAGKDIRRLVAHASVFDNAEKVNIVRRVLFGLEAVGVERVIIMPDSYGIGLRALDGIRLSIDASVLDMPLTASQEDSTRAAAVMAGRGVGAIVVLGGDGTNRAVARASGDVPLVPVSTGTNNAFPEMVEGTVAGMAAGLVARGVVRAAVRRVPCLEVLRGGEPVDIALVDAVVYDELFTGARAIWDAGKIRRVFLARTRVDATGMAALGAYLGHRCPGDGQAGAMITIGEGRGRVLVPIAPGMVRWLPVAACEALAPGRRVPVADRPAVIALDGEREVEVRPGDGTEIRLSPHGPRVVRIRDALAEAAQQGFFVDSSSLDG